MLHSEERGTTGAGAAAYANEQALLGKGALLSIAIGFVIGAGIMTLVGQALAVTGNSAWLAYLIAIGLGVLLNVPYLILTSTVTFSGGPYTLISSMLGNLPGGLYIVAYITSCVSTSLYGVSFGMYVNSLYPGVNQTLVAVIFMAIIYLFNIMGLQVMAWAQKLMSVLLLAALVIFVIFGIPHIDPVIFDPRSADFMTNGIDGLITAVFLLIYTCTAYNLVMNFGKSAKNPKRNIPWAMIMSVPIILVMYVGIAMINAGALPLEQTAGQPLTGVAQMILQTPLFIFFLIGGPLMALATTLNSFLGGITAPFLRAADDGWFPKVIGRRNRFGAPWVILTIVFAIGLIPVFLGFNVSTITNNVMLVQYGLFLLVYLSIWRMPYKFPEQWKQSRLHVPTPLFHLFMVLAMVVEVGIIFFAVRGLTVQIVVISLAAMAVCMLYAYSRYRAGKVHVAKGFWFD